MGGWSDLHRRLPASLVSGLPGATIFTVFWVTIYRAVNVPNAFELTMQTAGHSLGSFILDADPVGSLINLHMQPPLLNAIWALDFNFTPTTHYLLLSIWFTCGIASIFLIVDTLARVGIRGNWGWLAGIVYAALPGTVAYSLWPYSPTVCAFLAIGTIWGVAIMKSHPLAGSALSAVAMLLLNLSRTTFAWPILAAWCTALAVYGVARNGGGEAHRDRTSRNPIACIGRRSRCASSLLRCLRHSYDVLLGRGESRKGTQTEWRTTRNNWGGSRDPSRFVPSRAT